MPVVGPFDSGSNSKINGVFDARLQPTPDYGSLGPGSDAVALGSQPTPMARPAALRGAQLAAMTIGIIAALIAGTLGKNHQGAPKPAVARETNEQKSSGKVQVGGAQKEAENLLEQAVAHAPGAVEQISSRVDEWQGKVQWNAQIANLTTAALNSDDMRVRESGVEVELAAYGLSKNSQSLEYLLNTAESSDHGQKIWALWALGLMANRGVESLRVVEVLTAHLKDADAESRQWAVEGLALTGTDDAITALVKAMHDDPSPLVRERSACGLAQSGMFTPQQRFTVIPQLIDYSDDAALDAATHAWAFHALADITHQHLPNNSAAWRSWYQQRVANGQ